MGNAADELRRMEELENARKELEKNWKRTRRRSSFHRKCFEQFDIWRVCVPCFGRHFLCKYMVVGVKCF
ncbi:hypothetical protein D7X87_10210 [bacterium D16-54]|nr:hypothetical protein D7X87_10210 [bacterium D16-54]RKJ14708.1 hypothetical protein D7X65_10805 [bacterium D16-56]